MPDRSTDERPIFFYDLGSPYAWLVAERIGAVAPDAVWQPVVTTELSREPPWDGDRSRVERLANDLDLPRLRWPEESRPQAREPALAACFAKSIGRVVAFSLAAMRQAYNAGRDLADTDTLLLAAAACEMHPRAVLKALETESVEQTLAAAATLARSHGVTALPALSRGDDRVDSAALISLVASGVVGVDR